MIPHKPEPVSSYKPINEYEALMNLAPHQEPEEDREGLMELRDRVSMLLETLDPKLQWIINSIINEGKSLQDIADELAYTKTHIWRLRNQALDELKGIMMTDTVIRKRIGAANSWDLSATQWVGHIADKSTEVEPATIDDLETGVDNIMFYLDTHYSPLDTAGPQLERGFLMLAAQTVALMRSYGIWDTGQMAALLISKQRDYGSKTMLKFREYGVTIRLYDKIARLRNLGDRKASNESTHDTLVDVVGYCVIALMLMDGTFEMPLEEDK